MLYCGMDFSLRSCAGQISQMQGYISDTSVNDRLEACVPWVKAMMVDVFGFESVINNGSDSPYHGFYNFSHVMYGADQ